MKTQSALPLPLPAPVPAGRPYRPHDVTAVASLAASLGDMDLRSSEAELTRAGTDYHWYSPLLSERLQGRRPELVVRVRSTQEVIRVASACARHRVPLTPRGGGTGNYGQCVPLFGGVSLDMTGMNQVLRLEPGWASVEAGILVHDLNEIARARLPRLPGLPVTRQQLRMWPSTERIATLGGFIAGGHSGIGSIRHGILADPGNVRRLRIVTLEEHPRVIDLKGADIQKAHHAYGSNGIIVEVDEPQLCALMASFEADGCRVFDPHIWVLEDGGMKQVDTQQLDFKKLADPLGLMNPGKVRAWDEQVLGIPGGQL